MSVFVFDAEADGPIPGTDQYSMIAFGCVRVDSQLATTFSALLHPISDKWVPEALAVSGYTREETLEFPPAEEAMRKFRQWVLDNNADGHPSFISDNNGFDWSFCNYYLHCFTGKNVFGFSSRRIGDIYAGLQKDFKQQSQWKNLRKTKHTHEPLADCKGNAEALLEFRRLGLCNLFVDP